MLPLRVICHMSNIMCNMSHVVFLLDKVGELICGGLVISRLILPLQSEDQVKLEQFNSDFSNYFFVSCLKLSKMYSPSVFFKDGLMLYVFESLK